MTKYKIFDSVSYGDGDPLVPFCLVKEMNTLKEVEEFLEQNKDCYFICNSDNKLLFNSLDIK